MSRRESTIKVEYVPALDMRKMRIHPSERAVHWRGKRIGIDREPGRLGGWRMWLVCPECHGHFYVLRAVGDRVACRHCLGLKYKCQSETANDRLLRKADKLREKLGWVPGIVNPPGGRPKYMRLAVYKRLRQECLLTTNKVLNNYLACIKSHSGIKRCEYPSSNRQKDKGRNLAGAVYGARSISS